MTSRWDWDEPTRDGGSLEVATADLPDAPAAEAAPERAACLLVLGGPHLGDLHQLEPRRALVVGRGSDVDVRLDDLGCSRRHARFVADAEGYSVEDLGARNGTFVNGQRVEGSRALRDGDKVALGETVLKFAWQDRVDQEFQQRLREAALVDGLTQLVHREYFIRRLGVEVRHALRHSAPLAVMMLDVDHFKAINDRHGHLVGDGVLADIAHRIAGQLRAEDLAARYGGEEFAVFLRGTGDEGGVLVAERIRRAVAEAPVDPGRRAIPVTISLGVSALPHPARVSPSDLLAAADQALYEAKRAGRDRVVLAR